MAEAVMAHASKSQSLQTTKKGSRAMSKNLKQPRFKILDTKIPKPEIWARIRPPPKFEDNVLKVDEAGKRLGVQLDDPFKAKEAYVYPTDGILYNTSQEETFHLVANDLVDKALDGKSVLFLILGSAQSGKKFTLFGTPGKYDHRGLIPRTVDKLFNRMEVGNKDKMYQLFISGVQISQNHIKDLVTMTPYNIDYVGAHGPCLTLLHEVYNRDEAGAILHRIFTESKSEKNDIFSKKFHMFIYLDLCIITVNEKAPIRRSRITFAKVASIPKREHNIVHRNFGGAQGGCVDFQGCSCDPSVRSYSIRSLAKIQSKDVKFPYEAIKCCRQKLNNSDKSTDGIDIRRDLFFLEQLFVRANVLRKLSALKVKRPDLVKKFMCKLQVTPSQFIRQCKLTHCLKDMCKVETDIRVLIHVRPESAHLDTTMESLKFAERAKGITREAEFHNRAKSRPKTRSKKGGGNRASAQSLAESQKPEMDESLVSNLLAEAGQSGTDVTIGLNQYQVRMVQQQISQYFTEKLELKEVKEKPLKKPGKKATMNFNIVVGTTSKATRSTRPKPPDPSAAKQDTNKISTPPPTVVTEETVSSHPPPSRHSEQHDVEIKSGSGGETVEREKSADIIFKKDDEKHSKGKGKKEGLKVKTDPKSKKDKTKAGSHDSSSEKKPPSSAKANRKKSRSPFQAPPSTAPSSLKGKKKLKEEVVRQQMEEEIIEDSPPTCLEVWNAFLQNRIGYRSFMEHKRKLDSFTKITTEHTNLKKYSMQLLQKIIPLQAQLEDFKAKRFIKFKKQKELMKTIGISDMEKEIRYNIKIMQLSRDPLLVRLRNINAQVIGQDTGIEDTRKSCEDAFLLFSVHTFGMLFPVQEIPINIPGFQLDSLIANISTPPDKDIITPGSGHRKSGDIKRKRKSKNITHTSFAMRRRTKSVPELLVDSIHSKHYENVSRVGKVQATILRKLNRLRPPWVKY